MNIEKYTEELITLRHYFHQHPELALQEVETSAYIRKYLEKLGYEIVPIEPTGLIAELSSLRNREKLVVLRAEMDALPIQEQTNLPYASVNQGCMHACGHDMILAAALILAKIVAEEQRMQENFPVRLRFLFEPAEEIGEGAKRMLQAGALENPKADAFLMFHYAADMTFGMAVHQGQASSMINSMQIHVHGKSSHWCEADKGIKGMVEKDAYCIDILNQVSAAQSALNSFTKVLLDNHIKSCVVQDIKEGKDDTVEELVKTIGKFIR